MVKMIDSVICFLQLKKKRWRMGFGGLDNMGESNNHHVFHVKP